MDTSSVCRELKEIGAVHVKSFLSGSSLDNIEREYDKIFPFIPDLHEANLSNKSFLNISKAPSYKAGKHLRVEPSAYSSFPSLMSAFLTDSMRDLVNTYLGVPNQFCMQIFMSNEFAVLEEKDWSRNHYLHFDPYSSLKFMLYLTDVDEEGGATHYVPGSRETGKYYREEKMDLHDLTGLQGGCKHMLEDYSDPVAYTKEDSVPIIAQRGDLLILDTDTLHYGGLLKSPSNRKVILLHNRPY